MNKEQIIEGLRFTKEMFLLDPITNETMTKDQLNDMNRTTVDACEGAIEILQAIPNKTEIEAILQRFYNEEISCADMVQEMMNLGFVIER